GVDAEAPFFSLSLVHGAGAGHDDGGFRNDERPVTIGAEDFAIHHVVDRGSAGEDGSSSQHRAFANDGAFIHAAVAADQYVIFEDDGSGVDGLEDASDLRGGAEMNAATYLGAASYERVRINHGGLVHIRA